MVGAVARRAVAMAVQAVVPRKQAIERIEEIIVGAGPDLDDDQARGGVRDEDAEQAVAAGGHVLDEGGAGGRQIGDAAGGSGPDAELARLYGKMLRSASRIRPIPPPAGADS